MSKGILGKKVGMTQVFAENGDLIPVTVIEAAGNVVLQKKSEEKDGYTAVQVGYADQKPSRQNKPAKGHAGKAGVSPKRFVREFKSIDAEGLELGQEITVDAFAAGDIVNVTGTSKGKGFAGSIKRHNQSRGPMTHGSRYHRGPGAMGPIDPMHVFKGKNLPGQMGGEKVTVQNLEIVRVDAERNLLLIKGNVPGPRKSFVKVTSAANAN
ncbi:50S ribosomal protein L3 [Bacillaceae bacterium SIJ1]|uniref:50S ribosomal protein L3 n=1 Tax=Litoribacterium kuwaitense TaxID=1398745 RepID=UPI0013EA05F7|nr:50S ribosomal protein L3 [Litoribacterium kuwaitense]NGP45841.1 50S ribosomal protein L3 [Litoribacterium kuwaitense]